MPWSSRSLFSFRILTGRAQMMKKRKNRKVESIKAGVGKSCTSNVVCQVSLSRIASCILVTRKKWKEMWDFYEVSRNYHTMGQTQEECNTRVLPQKYTRYLKNIRNCFSCFSLKAQAQPTLALVLMTTGSCEKSWALRLWSNPSPKALALNHSQLSQAYSWT